VLDLVPLSLQWTHVAARARAGQHIRHDLWAQWFLFRDQATRDALVDKYREFAKSLAAHAYARRTDRNLEFEDYLHFALLGLLESVERYDSARGVPFEAYAAIHIRGVVLDGAEALSEQHRQAAARRRLIAERSESLRSASGKSEDAPAVDLSTLEGLAEMAIGLAIGFLLEDTALFQSDVDEPQVADTTYRRTVLRQAAQAVHDALELLDVRSRRIVAMHYLQGMSFRDIAADMALTPGRISQLHRAALKQLAQLIHPAHAGLDQHL